MEDGVGFAIFAVRCLPLRFPLGIDGFRSFAVSDIVRVVVVGVFFVVCARILVSSNEVSFRGGKELLFIVFLLTYYYL